MIKEIQKLLFETRKSIPHRSECNAVFHLKRRKVDRWETADHVLWDVACNCDREVIFEALVAQGVEAMIREVRTEDPAYSRRKRNDWALAVFKKELAKISEPEDIDGGKDFNLEEAEDE